MQWHRTITSGAFRPTSIPSSQGLVTAAQHAIRPVSNLPSWELAAFRELAFQKAIPARLSSSQTTLAPACQKWFFHSRVPSRPSNYHDGAELNYVFWQQYHDIIVPIELTQTSPSGTKTFHRSDGPLKLFLDHSASQGSALIGIASRPLPSSAQALYVAQCPLNDLPQSLQQDLPTPELVLKADKGDIYDSSLWMGRPPTFTPLHKDPNPNLFMQLAGRKVVRLFNPEVGRAIFHAVQASLGGKGNAAFRGEEMMQGREREDLEDAVWGDGKDELSGLSKEGFETTLDMGDALFIPKGWWHSVRGIGTGMNASVNWWFR